PHSILKQTPRHTIKVFKEKGKFYKTFLQNDFSQFLNAKKQPKNLEVTKNQRIFAKGFKRLYYDNIRVTK
ncbi:hypothetical protein OSK27_25665, partial [Escherichia coli]|nr:hypothetical protein [Escherichia coli]